MSRSSPGSSTPRRTPGWPSPAATPRSRITVSRAIAGQAVSVAHLPRRPVRNDAFPPFYVMPDLKIRYRRPILVESVVPNRYSDELTAPYILDANEFVQDQHALIKGVGPLRRFEQPARIRQVSPGRLRGRMPTMTCTAVAVR